MFTVLYIVIEINLHHVVICQRYENVVSVEVFIEIYSLLYANFVQVSAIDLRFVIFFFLFQQLLFCIPFFRWFHTLRLDHTVTEDSSRCI